ncbi:helix-turn-helix transcriptional regulator [Alteromonas sp. 5E99-2]|uniref:helix-turn-helix transcriptional regulator n=1 Tax=Alteromonas sp. 5E99-2 TaxID=2817683 RepID=UPI001A98E0D2|nr:helix-turn-helix transcriptional regulator [Alteromonas sp. 5E99-2]MBO1255002.1 helix-turn-helix transcriptional regulator [Alteromonas sp. 5E99-2]
MEMQVNINLIKTERINRAWSQTQLALVSGLSLRTIQRIEKTGVASLESVKSLASAFEISAQDIQQCTNNSRYSTKSKFAAFFGLVSFTLSCLVMIPASAQPIMVNVELIKNDEKLANIHLLSEESSVNEISISDSLKLTLFSSKQPDGMVLISTKLYEISNGYEVLVSSPSVKTNFKETAKISFEDYSISLTPNS